ncbi:MAG: hypothetical protein OXI23_05300 [Gemmatimonadota bacterium]|nr:hypothetical protein [Gemmatimonadota bacterium]
MRVGLDGKGENIASQFQGVERVADGVVNHGTDELRYCGYFF